MAKRSLQASQEGARLARKAFDLKGWTQENLAAELELKTRQPIWRFFTCRPIERHIFVELCHILDLNWWEIAEHPPEFLLETVRDPQEPLSLSPQTESRPSDVELFVERIRASCRDWIENQCSVLRVLGTSSPVCFDALYVPVDVIHATRVSAIQAVQEHSKLRVLGKPGSGKTVLLKYLALQCIRGAYEAGKVPMLIYLDRFAAHVQESGKGSLLDFICYELSGRGIPDLQMITTLLTEGRFLLLLDAIDEIEAPVSYAVYKEITRFTERYYSNPVVMTARLASDRFEFSHFTDVEVADFTDEQLKDLSNRWFRIFSRTAVKQPDSTEFLQQLRLPENQSIANLVRLPLLFNPIAQLFQKRGNLSAYHLDIYATCLNILFERWDRARGVNRSLSGHLLGNLSGSLPGSLSGNFPEPDVPVTVKEAVLTQLAAIGFQQHRFWFKKQEVLQWIEEYLYQLYPGAIAPTIVQAMSKTILVALEQHHGLLIESAQGCFAFSFPGFQSYFTARWIASGESSDSALATLARHVADPQWREAVLLSCALITAGDPIIDVLNQALNQLMAEHRDLIGLMDWTQQLRLKFSTCQELHPDHFFQQLVTRTPRRLAQAAFALAVLQALEEHLLLEVLLERLFRCALLLTLEDGSGLETAVTLLDQVIAISNQGNQEFELQQLRSLRQRLPDLNQPCAQFQDWWQTSYALWVDQLRQVLTDWHADDRYCNLTADQQQILECYAYLTQLLSNCLELRSNRQNDLDSTFPRVMQLCFSCVQKTQTGTMVEHF